LRGVPGVRESSGEILSYLAENKARLGKRGTPKPLYEDEWTQEDFDTWANELGENELKPLCNIGDGLLVQSDTNLFYLVIDKIFHELGHTREEVLEFFNGKKNIKDAKRHDPFHVLEAHQKHVEEMDAFLREVDTTN